MEFSTRTIHAGQPSEPGTGSLIAPIFQTSTYEQEAPGQHRGFDYSRTNNPTRARLEDVLADLEGVAHAAVFASGLAAENAILQAYLKPGDEIVIPLETCAIQMIVELDVELVEAHAGDQLQLLGECDLILQVDGRDIDLDVIVLIRHIEYGRGESHRIRDRYDRGERRAESGVVANVRSILPA